MLNIDMISKENFAKFILNQHIFWSMKCILWLLFYFCLALNSSSSERDFFHLKENSLLIRLWYGILKYSYKYGHVHVSCQL